jgi:hypothetical protein
MTTIVFDVAAFRLAYPQFADDTKFPDAVLQGYWDTATCFICPEDYGYLHGKCRERAINLMTAHLAALSVIIASGETPGMVQGATIDKVSVTLTPPPVKTQLAWWLNLTPYGMQLWALLEMSAVGGMFIGGSQNYAAFRKPNGRF